MAYDEKTAERVRKVLSGGRRTMTGFIRVALDGYRTDAALKKWIERSLDFVATLPAKPARGKASSGKPSRGKAVRKTAKSRKTRQPSPRNS